MDHAVVKDAACTYCGCVCDDIELHADGARIVKAKRACSLGRAWFFNHTAERKYPEALIDGKPATVDAALAVAARILNDADMPLIFGLGNSTCEAQREAVTLAEQLGAVIDSHTSLSHGPTKVGGQLVGKVTCSLGEVMNRADLIIYWGSNPAESHPRHFTKYTLSPKGKFVPRGRQGRTMILVDIRETLSGKAANHFLQVRPGMDFEVLIALRALLKNQPVNRELVASTGLTIEQLQDLLNRMKRTRFGVIFFGNGLTSTRGKHMNGAALFALTADLNAFTKFATMPMRDLGNEAGTDNVMSWLTGHPFGVSYNRGYSRSNPGEFTGVDMLVRQDADAALLVGIDPEMTMPRLANEHLARIPTIVLANKTTSTSPRASVHFTTAATGISAGGTVYRMDKIPLPLRPILRSPYPTDEEVLQRIRHVLRA